MKAPNKIYVEVCEDGIFAFPEPPFKESVEYIRKDALLVFLNERRKGLTSGDSFVAGERKMLKEIIEKIESL